MLYPMIYAVYSCLYRNSSSHYRAIPVEGREKKVRRRFGRFSGFTFDLVSGRQCICVCAVPHPLCTYAPISSMPYIQHLGLDDGGVGGEFTYPNGTSPHTWGTNLHTTSSYVPLTNTIFLRSDTAATIFSLPVFLWLLFEDGVYFFGKLAQTSTMAG